MTDLDEPDGAIIGRDPERLAFADPEPGSPVAVALAALAPFHPETMAEARILLHMWARHHDITPDDRQTVLTHYHSSPTRRGRRALTRP